MYVWKVICVKETNAKSQKAKYIFEVKTIKENERFDHMCRSVSVLSHFQTLDSSMLTLQFIWPIFQSLSVEVIN